MEFPSCEWIEYRMVLEPLGLKFCCMAHSKNKGFVPICKFEGGNFPIDRIMIERDRLRELNNTGCVDSPCYGCPSLSLGKWDKLPGKALFNRIEINNFTVCNLKCNYCYTVVHKEWNLPKYGYELKPLFTNMIENGMLDENSTLEWAGGEATILKDFEEVFSMLLDHGHHQTVFTNAVIFSDKIEKALKCKKSSTVTSIDSGTRETYKRIKGKDHFDTVWRNIARYVRTGGVVVVKYIVKCDNSNESDIMEFVRLCYESGVRQITVAPDSYEFRSDTITEESLFGASLIARKGDNLGIDTQIQYNLFGETYSAEIKKYFV